MEAQGAVRLGRSGKRITPYSRAFCTFYICILAGVEGYLLIGHYFHLDYIVRQPFLLTNQGTRFYWN